MSDVHPLLTNTQYFKKGDLVRVKDDPTFDIERYVIVEVLGEDELQQYAILGLQTGGRFSYFRPDELAHEKEGVR